MLLSVTCSNVQSNKQEDQCSANVISLLLGTIPYFHFNDGIVTVFIMGICYE